jgi:23S rRNA pseudouridine1911/1915/1917 synthase
MYGISRQALHAHHLGFEHPVTEEPMSFDADLPADMQALLKALRGR